jgi:hypothetical protein
VRPMICMAAQPDLFGVTNSDVAVAGARRVVGAIEALPAVLDQQTVVGLYAHLGEQLTHEQEAGITAFRSVRPGTVVKPAALRSPSAGTAGMPGQSARPSTGSAARPSTGSTARPARRPAHRPAVRGNPSGAHSRDVKARQHGTGVGRLALLAAFVIFAVYVLPYWAR